MPSPASGRVSGRCDLSLQVHQDIHEIGAGLEYLGIGRVAALGLDHGGQFLGDVDVGVRSGLFRRRNMQTRTPQELFRAESVTYVSL